MFGGVINGADNGCVHEEQHDPSNATNSVVKIQADSRAGPGKWCCSLVFSQDTNIRIPSSFSASERIRWTGANDTDNSLYSRGIRIFVLLCVLVSKTTYF